MNKLPLIGIALSVLAACQMPQELPPAPEARQDYTVNVHHGDSLHDNYAWMRLSDEQKKDSLDAQANEVREYLEAENTYLETVTAEQKGLRDKLFEEIKGRIKQDDSSVPVERNGYSYYTKFEEGADYPVYYRQSLAEGAEPEVILDMPKMAEGKAYYSISFGALYDVTEDARRMAFAVDTLSRRIYTIHFKDLETGEILDERIENVTSNFVWANDGKHLFYSRKDPQTLRSYRIYRHELGTDPAQDTLVFEETDETFSTYVTISSDRSHLFVLSTETQSSEWRYLDANNPTGDFKMFLPREPEHEYGLDIKDDRFLVWTNDNAQNFRLMTAPLDQPGRAAWTELLAHREDVLIEGMQPLKDYLVVTERKDGLKRLRVLCEDCGEDRYIGFDDPAYNVGMAAVAEYDKPVIRYQYTSLTTPWTTYDHDLSSGERTQRKQQEVIGDFDPGNYVSERIMVTARDGAEVPMSLVYRKGMEKNSANPLLLYGYGSYGNNVDASFSSVRLSLLDRGFIYAIAHVRGSQTLGRAWYEDGKLLKKMNTFNDFIDCGKFLIEEGYTAPEHQYAYGGSAGGLLMGAVINLEPSIWNGVIAAVPFVDVMNTMLDETIPLTTFEYNEWGNPNEKEYYDYMRTYSPYDNVKEQDYPHMLVTTGFWDSQVQYWEPAKWVAKLRDMKTDDNQLLLYTNMDVGHGGNSGRFERYKDIARQYSFLLSLEGIGE